MATSAATPSQRRAIDERDGRLRRGMDPRHSTASGLLLPPNAVQRVAFVPVLEFQPRRQARTTACLVNHHPADVVAPQDGGPLGGRCRRFEEEEPRGAKTLAILVLHLEGDVAGRRHDDPDGGIACDPVGRHARREHRRQRGDVLVEGAGKAGREPVRIGLVPPLVAGEAGDRYREGERGGGEGSPAAGSGFVQRERAQTDKEGKPARGGKGRQPDRPRGSCRRVPVGELEPDPGGEGGSGTEASSSPGERSRAGERERERQEARDPHSLGQRDGIGEAVEDRRNEGRDRESRGSSEDVSGPAPPACQERQRNRHERSDLDASAPRHLLGAQLQPGAELLDLLREANRRTVPRVLEKLDEPGEEEPRWDDHRAEPAQEKASVGTVAQDCPREEEAADRQRNEDDVGRMDDCERKPRSCRGSQERQPSLGNEREDERQQRGNQEQPGGATGLGEELERSGSFPSECKKHELARSSRDSARPRAKQRCAGRVGEQECERSEDGRQVEDDERGVDAGEAGDEREPAVPERESVARVDALPRDLVHDRDRPERAGIVELANASQMEKRIADARPQTPADRPGRPPESARQRGTSDEEREDGPDLGAVERRRCRTKRQPEGGQHRSSQQPYRQAERPGDGKDDREDGEDEGEAPGQSGRESDADRAGRSEGADDEGARKKENARGGSREPQGKPRSFGRQQPTNEEKKRRGSAESEPEPGPALHRASLCQAVSTLMTLVVPGTLTAVPAVMTTRSPGWTRPVARDASSVRAQRSSTSLHSSISAEITPHSSASC